MAKVVFVETFFLGGGIGLVQGEEGGAEDFRGRRKKEKKKKRVSVMSLGRLFWIETHHFLILCFHSAVILLLAAAAAAAAGSSSFHRPLSFCIVVAR